MGRWILVQAGLVVLVGCTGLKEDPDAGAAGAGMDAGAGGGSGAAAGSGGSSGAGPVAGSGGSSGVGGAGGAGAGGAGAGGARAGGTSEPSPTCTGCSASATCQVVDGAATCVCVSPYVGDGMDCQLDASCALLDCDENAECVVDGAARSCRCLAGYDGTGVICTNVDDCDPDPCRNGGVCSDLVAGFSCACTDTGYQGDTCSENVDDCAGSPCQNGGVCTDLVKAFMCNCTGTGYEGTTCADNHDDCAPNPCVHGTCTDLVNDHDCSCATGYSGDNCTVDSCNPSPCPAGFACTRATAGPICTPTCGSECQLGQQCLQDSHCANGLSCDPDDDVCVGPCAGGPITSVADLADFEYCATVNGNLTIESAGSPFTTIAATDLRYLKTINGSLLVGEIDDTALASVTFSALERVTVLIRFQAQPGMTLISMPALTSVGTTAGSLAHGITIAQGTTGRLTMPELTTVNGGLSFGLSSLDSIELRKLATINGSLNFGDFPSPVGNVDLRALRTVTGNLNARFLFSVPFTDVSHLTMNTVTVGGTRTVNEIGCCFINSSSSLAYMCSGSFADYQSYCD